MNAYELLTKVKKNLIIEHTSDDTLLGDLISAAIDYAEKYQHLESGWYAEHDAGTTTEQAVIMLASHWYESRDGSTGGFFADNVQAGGAAMTAINNLLRLDREWTV